MTNDPIFLARNLLRCPSVTPAEGDAITLVESLLKRAGFDLHRVTFAESGTAAAKNLLALRSAMNAAAHSFFHEAQARNLGGKSLSVASAAAR